MAADLISSHIAPAETLLRSQKRTGSTVFVFRQCDDLTGVLAMIPVTPEGCAAILEDRFDARNPPEGLLCAPGDELGAVYGWGLAGVTRRASAAVMMGAMALRDAYPEVPFFSRTATAAGAKVVRGRMGYSPYPGAPDDLLWNPVRPLIEERAA